MTFEIRSTKNVSPVGRKIIVYGPPKIGKTRLTGTMQSPFIVNTERGTLSLREFNIPYGDVSSEKDLEQAYIYLQGPGRQFNDISFDSVSDLGEVIVGEKKKGTRDGRKAYGETNDTLMGIFRAYRDMPDRNVLFIAKEQQYQGANNLQCVRPSMPDAYLTQQLPYMFDVIAHMEYVRFPNGEVHVGLRCKGNEQVVAGDRSGALAEFEPPNLAYIFDKMTKG